MMQAREQRGLQLVAGSQLRSAGVWIVPSQSSATTYTVDLNSVPPTCNCPDNQQHDFKCKHIFAAEYAAQCQQSQPIPTVPEVVKPKYSQAWHEYNLAQVNEKAKFQELLFDLCKGIAEPVQTFGRPRVPMADMLFAVCMKVYECMSGRRNQTDMREALQRGYLSRPVHYNTISKYLEKPELTAYLKQLIIESALPLKSVEENFAVDSSGFSTGQFTRWIWQKYGGGPQERQRADWVKVHLVCGCKTNIVTSVEVSEGTANDSPFFRPLVNQTACNFEMKTVVADTAYSSGKNLQLVVSKSATPYIPFKANATGNDPRQSALWKRMFHYIMLNQEEFMARYHRRSNVETTFSMIKAKFGERLRSKTRTAQIKEALAKVLCHNICVVIQSMYELGIEADFAPERAARETL
jgi:transposase